MSPSPQLWMERSSGHVFDSSQDDIRTVTREISFYEASKSVYKTPVDSSLLTIPPLASPLGTLKRREISPLLKHAFVLENILSPSECENLIEQVEKIGLTKWTTEAEKLTFRDCDTIEIRHEALADLIWQRILPSLTPEERQVSLGPEDYRHQRDLTGTWIGHGTSKDVLFARYGMGDHFSKHTDGFNVEAFDVRSLFSVVLYLNNGVENGGGETVFFCGDEEVARESPVAGGATIFFHNIYHQSRPITKGKKYIIRSDIMYHREPALIVTEEDKLAFERMQQAEYLAESDPEESSRLFQLAFKKSAVLSRVYGI